MSYCKKCGNEITGNSNVCLACGCPLKNYNIQHLLNGKDTPIHIKNDSSLYWLFYMCGGILWGIIMGAFLDDMAIGLIGGILFGLLFGLIMQILLSSIDKKVQPIRNKISKENLILIEGGANLSGAGGWLFVTDKGIEFHTHNFNFDNRNFSYTHDEIVSIKKNGRKLVIITTKVKYVLNVDKVETWINLLKCN